MLRTKTIECALTTLTQSISSSVPMTFNPITIYVPETGSREFKSCFVEFGTEDNNGATILGLNGLKYAYKLNSASPVTESQTFLLIPTGESLTYINVLNVTPYFSSSFGNNTSQSFDFNVVMTGSFYCNSTAKLYMTYQYDDIADKKIKTISIPIDSYPSTASATSSYGELIDNLPALDTYLPEANKNYRNIFIECEMNDAQIGTGSVSSASFFLDSGSMRYNTGFINQTNISARYFRYILNCDNLDTTTTHSISLRPGNSNLNFCHFASKLVVTYEYTASLSDYVMNNAIYQDFCSGFGGSSVIDRTSYKMFLQEPNITMSRCGIYHYFIDSGAVSCSFQMASGIYTQSVVRYNQFSNLAYCGGLSRSTRYDTMSYSRGGQGINLVRGENTFQHTWVKNSGLLTAYSYYNLLNYTSRKSSQSGGDANHSNIVKYFLCNYSTPVTQRTLTGSVSLTNFETSSYYLTSHGIYLYSVVGNPLGINVSANYTGSEWYYEGKQILYDGNVITDQEIGYMSNIANLTNVCKKHNTDVNTGKFNPFINRMYNIDITSATSTTGYLVMNYHTIKYLITGSVSGYSGDGSGLNVKFYRSDTDEFVLQTTSTIGGQFNTYWYDNTIPLYATVYQDNTRVGRSANSTASGSP